MASRMVLGFPEATKAMQTDLSGSLSSFGAFFSGEDKSVLPSWNYVVNFSKTDYFGYIKAFHILDVSIPFYKFSKNTTVYGSVPKSYSTFSSESGLEFSITFEEDYYGTVTSMVHTFQKTIMRSTGVYNTLPTQNLGHVFVNVYDSAGTPVMSWTMKDIYFLGAEDISLTYSSTDSMKIKVNFGCDIVEYNNNMFAVE